MKHQNSNIMIDVHRPVNTKDRKTIDKLVSIHSGITRATVSEHVSRIMFIEYDPAVTNAKHIRQHVENLGFTGSLVGF